MFRKRWFRWFFSLLVLVGLTWLYNQDLLHDPVAVSNPLWIAHRGASAYAPENTLPAFQEALDRGADMIELDVHFSKDQRVVVIHDADLDRTTNGTGLVVEHSWKQLEKLDAGTWFLPAFGGTKIPLLEEVLEQVAGKIPLLIELKWPKEGAYAGLADSVLAIIDRYEARSWCEIQTFDQEMARRFWEIAPEITSYKLIFLDVPLLPGHIDRTWQWTDGSRFAVPVAGINPSLHFLNPRLVNRIHDQGLTIFVYTPNSPAEQAKCRKLGVDGMISDVEPNRSWKP